MLNEEQAAKKPKQKQPNNQNPHLQKQFQINEVIGRGTFGIVYSAHWITQNTKVAVKSIIKNPKYKNRQIQVLASLKNQSIIQMLLHYQKYDQVSKKNYINLVMEYVPSTLSAIIKNSNAKNKKIQLNKILIYSKKMLEGLAYLQQKCICHRDIKPSNVLIDETNNKVKICDFGSAKQLKKGQKSITYICSRYYRAPELVLGCAQYTTKIDVWAAGCVIAQLIALQPLFDGSSNLDQIAKIIKVLGSPTQEDLAAMKIQNFNGDIQKIIPLGISAKLKKASHYCPEQLINLIQRLVVYNPEKRLSPKQALMHPVFKQLQT